MKKEKPLLHLYYPVSDEAWRNPEKRDGEIPEELKKLTDQLRDIYRVSLIPGDCYRLYFGLGPGVHHSYPLIKSFLEALAN